MNDICTIFLSISFYTSTYHRNRGRKVSDKFPSAILVEQKVLRRGCLDNFERSRNFPHPSHTHTHTKSCAHASNSFYVNYWKCTGSNKDRREHFRAGVGTRVLGYVSSTISVSPPISAQRQTCVGPHWCALMTCPTFCLCNYYCAVMVLSI